VPRESAAVTSLLNRRAPPSWRRRHDAEGRRAGEVDPPAAV